MPAYWIAHVRVRDDEAYKRYAARATEIIPAHGGEFLVRAGRYRQLEGTDSPRNVVARFPTFEQAVACYESPEYQEVLRIALSAAERDVVIVEGG